MERPPGRLFVGEQIDQESGDRTGASVLLDSADFTTHGVIVGMTGSGKTGLGVVLIEEALVAGIPVLAIDPKGDLGNLCLTFPDLAPSSFEPWIDQGAARVQQRSVAELAESTAELWRDGLDSWGLGGADVAELAAAATPVVYTPGSSNGIPLDVLGRLSAPTTDDAGARQDEIDSTVSGLLALIGVKSDPLSGREHILLANLIARAWEGGAELDLPTLLSQILDPPIRKLGVLDLDTFFPPADRQSLVLKLNGLLASPSFAQWAEGAPLDINRMLWTDSGKARAAVLSLGHLEETERQFAVTLVLGKLISWMRTQSGTGELRVLVYIDEVMGFAPPVGNPPTKKPILTLLKQARAFGVGLVLSTQNPVDLDYKAISNAGTWLIGRLQTEQDKRRLVDGLRSADGTTDLNAVEATISGLGKRQFLLRTTRSPDLPLFTTRWAMSYLAGPMTGEQLGVVMADERAALTATTNARTGAGAGLSAGAGASPSNSAGSSVGARAGASNSAGSSVGAGASPSNGAGSSAGAGSSRAEAEAITGAASGRDGPAQGSADPATVGKGAMLADDESTVAPDVPDSLPTRYAAAGAPWLGQVGAEPGAGRLKPFLAARVELLFDETKADLRHVEEWEAIIPFDEDGIDLGEMITVDFDDRDFTSNPPDNPVYVLPIVDLSTKVVRAATADLKAKLYSEMTVTLHRNTAVKLWSRPGESLEEFTARCEAAADEGADADAVKIRERLEKRQASLEAALAKADDRVNELQVQVDGRKQQQLVDIGSSLLGSLLGGRGRARKMASAARRAASGQRQTSAGAARLESARRRVAEKVEALDELELDLAAALIEIDDEWSAKAADISEVEIPLEKSDITVEDLSLVWLPVERS